MSYKVLGFVWVLIGAFLFSTKAIMVKLIYQFEVTHIATLTLRMLFALPFYIYFLATTKKASDQVDFNKENIFWVMVFGILGYYLASYFDFHGLVYISAGLERVILFLYPTLVVLMNWMFFKHKISTIQLLALAITYFGITIAYAYDVNTESKADLIKGGLLIMASSLTYASFLVGSGWLVPKLGTLRFTSAAMIVSSACVLLHHFVLHSDLPLLGYPTEVYIYSMTMAIFATVIPSFLISQGIKIIGSSNAAIAGSVGPVSTICLSVLILGEVFHTMQIVGTILVIVGVFLISNKSTK